MAITAARMWLDGAMVASIDATLSLMGHAAQRGSLAFDVGSFHPTADGAALFRAREHVSRFLQSARTVGLDLPYTQDALLAASLDVVVDSGATQGLIRWSAFFAAEQPDLLPRSCVGRVAIAVQLPQDPPSSRPLRVAVFADARKASPDVLDPTVKAAGAYLGPMLARRRAVAAGMDDVVLLDRDGNLAEAPIANVFAVFGDVLSTPPLGCVLPGITRDSVLAIARDEGLAVREAPITPASFAAADEAFLTGTSMPLSPIGHINEVALKVAPGRITERLLRRLVSIQGGRDGTFAGWLTPIGSRR